MGSGGPMHLSKGKWNNLMQLSLGRNDFGLDGYSSLNNGNWNQAKRLETMQLNEINSFSKSIYEEPILRWRL